MADQRRVYRVAEKIREVVAQYLLFEGQAELSSITVTNVRVSKDLRHARVYWMAHSGEGNNEALAALLSEKAGEIRHTLGKNLQTRFVPEISFFYDQTLDEVEKVERLFDRIKNQDQQKAKEKEDLS